MLLTIGWLATALYAWYVATDPPEKVARFFDLFVYFVPLLMASAACASRAKRSPEVRGIWAAFALGLLLWLAGDVYWTVMLENQGKVSYPSLADAGYLLALPVPLRGRRAHREVPHRTFQQRGLARWWDRRTRLRLSGSRAACARPSRAHRRQPGRRRHEPLLPSR